MAANMLNLIPVLLLIATGVWTLNIAAAEEDEVKEIIIDMRKDFVIPCNITVEPGEEKLEIEWQNEEGRQIKPSKKYHMLPNRTMKVTNATEDDCGIYTCNLNASDANTSYSVQVNARPRIWPGFEMSHSIIEGDDLTLRCVVYACPEVKVFWEKDGVNLTENDRVSFAEETSNQTISLLKIKAVVETDRAKYTCHAVNKFGEDKEVILVRVKDKLAALWPFLGIVAEVAVLCTIIFIYEKRRAKQEYEESDTDQSPDTKNNETKDKDVRQRK